MKEIKSIQTEYDGHLFRSRLEARWAVFFKSAGIKYKYEEEGFSLPSGRSFLPDFYLPHIGGRCYGGLYVEVKGELSDEDYEKIDEFANIDRSHHGDYLEQSNSIIIVGKVPISWKQCSELQSNDPRFWSFRNIDADDYTAFFYHNPDGSVGLIGADAVSSFEGFSWFDEHFQKAAYARFEYGEKPI